MRNAKWLWLVPAVWAVSIYATSSSVVTIPQLSRFVSTVTGGAVSIEGFTTFWLAIWWFVVKGWHAAEFAILYIVLSRWIKTPAWLPIALTAACALGDEVHQMFVPGRGGRLSDVVIDWLGIVAVLGIRHWKAATPTNKGERKVRPFLTKTLWVGIWVLALYLLSMVPFGTFKWDGSRFTSGQKYEP